MATANELYPAKKWWSDRTRHRHYRELEAHLALTVLSLNLSRDPQCCSDCGGAGPIWQCHCWAEPRRPIRALCRQCAICRAGGEERIWLHAALGVAANQWKAGSVRVRTVEKAPLEKEPSLR